MQQIDTAGAPGIATVLAWLDEGAVLALGRYGAGARHDQVIWALLRQALAEHGRTERARAVLGWMVYFARAQNPLRFRLGVQALASGGRVADLERALGRPPGGITRQAFKNFKMRAATYIIEGLRRDYGIVPGAGCRFEFGSTGPA